jgi:hypothetical protein
MRIRAVLSATALTAAALAILAPRAAHADAGAALPLTTYYQMAVDTAHRHLFFSQGSTSKNSILVTDFSGGTVATITGQTGVMGITLSPDGGTLYAALSGAHAVTAISTATLKQTAVYSLGAANTPLQAAVQSGKLWVSYDTGSAVSPGAVGDFDLSAATPALETSTAMKGYYSAPVIAADPGGTGDVLIVLQPASEPASAWSYNTATAPASLRTSAVDLAKAGNDNCDLVTDLTVVPGGAQFVPACAAPAGLSRYDSADLSYQGSYSAAVTPNSIAIAAGTGLVAVGGPGSADIDVYQPGGDTPVNVFNAGGIGTLGTGLCDRGLALTADESELFAVTGANGRYTLHAWDLPALSRPALTLSGVTSVPVGHPVTLGGTLRTPAGSPLGGATVTVTRTGPGSTAKLTATTGSDGSYSVADTPSAGGSYSYAARYAGDASETPATATAAVTVTRVAPPLSVSVTPQSATYRPAVHVTVRLATANGDRTVSVYAKPAGSTRRILLKTGVVSSTGTMTLLFRATHTTTFSAVFAGDANYTPRTVTATASVAASVTMKIGGYFASKIVGSVTYRLYHSAKRLTAAAAVAPDKHGECVKFDMQEFYKGTWYDRLTGCGALGTKSTIGTSVALGNADLGYRYRLRAVYLRGKDTTNLSADSAWQHFIVEK